MFVKPYPVYLQSCLGETHSVCDALTTLARKDICYREPFILTGFHHRFSGDRTVLPMDNNDIRTFDKTVHQLTQWLVSPQPVQQIFRHAYHLAQSVGDEMRAGIWLARLNVPVRCLSPSVVKAAWRLCSYHYFTFDNMDMEYFRFRTQGQPDNKTVNQITRLVNRAALFFTQENVQYVDQFPAAINPHHHPVKRSVDTVWEMPYRIPRYPCYAEKVSPLVTLIMLKHEGHDPTGELTKFGIYDVRRNTAKTFDIRKLDLSVYKGIVNTIYT